MPGAALGVVALGMIACAGGCKTDDKVVRYKPFFANIADAKFGDGQEGFKPVNPNAGYIDPSKLPSDKLVEEHTDGTKTLYAKSVRHMMSHVERTLDEGDDEALLEQVISEKAKDHWRKQGKSPDEIVAWMHENRKEIAKTFARMPMGEYSPTIIIDRPGDKTWVLRITGKGGEDLKFRRLWTRMEEGNWKFLWMD